MAFKFEVRVSYPVRKSLIKIPISWRRRIIEAMEVLEDDPFYGVMMHGTWDGKRKITVWPYRIFYVVYKKARIVNILKIRHRGSAGYK